MGRRGEKWRGDEMGRPAITDSPCGPPACTALTQSTSLAGVCGNRVGVGCGVVVVVCAVREHSVVRAGRCAYLPKVQARVWAMWGCFGWSVNAYLSEVAFRPGICAYLPGVTVGVVPHARVAACRRVRVPYVTRGQAAPLVSAGLLSSEIAVPGVLDLVVAAGLQMIRVVRI